MSEPTKDDILKAAAIERLIAVDRARYGVYQSGGDGLIEAISLGRAEALEAIAQRMDAGSPGNVSIADIGDDEEVGR